MITAHSYFTIAFSICVLTPRHNDCTTMTCCFLSYIVAFCSCPNVMNQLSKPLIKNGRSLLLLTALLHKSYINANKQGFSGICHEAHVIVGQSWKWCMLMLYSGKVKWVYNPTTNSNLAHGCVLCVCVMELNFTSFKCSSSLNMVQVFYVHVTVHHGRSL